MIFVDRWSQFWECNLYLFVGQLHLISIGFKVKYGMVSKPVIHLHTSTLSSNYISIEYLYLMSIGFNMKSGNYNFFHGCSLFCSLNRRIPYRAFSLQSVPFISINLFFYSKLKITCHQVAMADPMSKYGLHV